MKELLEYLLKEITGSTEFEISESEDGDTHTFEVNVSPEIIGLVIGKGGRTIKSIQTLLRVRARLDNKKVYVNVEERN